MEEEKRTVYTREAIGLADRFGAFLGSDRITTGTKVVPNDYHLELTAPEGMSTGGGAQAVQSIKLVPERGPAIVCGTANQKEKTAEIRTHGICCSSTRSATTSRICRSPSRSTSRSRARWSSSSRRWASGFRRPICRRGLGRAAPKGGPEPDAAHVPAVALLVAMIALRVPDETLTLHRCRSTSTAASAARSSRRIEAVGAQRTVWRRAVRRAPPARRRKGRARDVRTRAGAARATTPPPRR